MIALICGDVDVRHWGLTPRERLTRHLAAKGARVVHERDDLEGDETCLVVRGDVLVDSRLVDRLVSSDESLALVDAEGRVTAVRVPARRAGAVAEALSADEEPALADLPRRDGAQLLAGATHSLLKAQYAFIVRVTAEERSAHENLLYDASYKGVTDLVTKFAWPVPARWCVHLAVRLGLRPNHLTALGFVLMLAALALFWRGQWAAGLVCGWIMTFLDTVDGKLARTTVTSSRIGHWCDKLMDIIHPPFWYIAWGVGLSSWTAPMWPDTVSSALWATTIAYVVGRFVELGTSELLVRGGLFVWKPIDSYIRLITARRNTCLIPLTGFTIAGRPDLALWSVAALTVVTTGILFVRMIQAWLAKPRGGERLASWLLDVDLEGEGGSLAVRLFTQRRRA